MELGNVKRNKISLMNYVPELSLSRKRQDEKSNSPLFLLLSCFSPSPSSLWLCHPLYSFCFSTFLPNICQLSMFFSQLHLTSLTAISTFWKSVIGSPGRSIWLHLEEILSQGESKVEKCCKRIQRNIERHFALSPSYIHNISIIIIIRFGKILWLWSSLLLGLFAKGMMHDGIPFRFASYIHLSTSHHSSPFMWPRVS
jgi:hypothetical protein